MRFFKYLVLVFITLFSASAYSAVKYKMQNAAAHEVYSTKEGACSNWKHTWIGNPEVATKVDGNYCRAYRVKDNGAMGHALILEVNVAITCPSAKQVALKVAVNAQKYQCLQGCQYGLTKCVDIDFEPGMTCDAISTGIECGGSPPKKPSDNSQAPDENDKPAAPNQNSNNINSNTATTTGTSTSTSTSTTTNNTTNNTSTTNTTTTTNTNTTTKIDLSSLEAAIRSLGSLLGGKLDAIKEALGADSGSGSGSADSIDLTETNQKLDDIKKNGEKTNNWLQGKSEDGTGGGFGDNPFGTDVTPEKVLDAKSFKTDIFQSNAQCPADKTLSMTLFTGRTFTRTLSFSMWCDKLAIFGSFILIAAYLYGASIIVRNS